MDPRLCRAISPDESVVLQCLIRLDDTIVTAANAMTPKGEADEACRNRTHEEMNPPQLPIILALGTTQTLAWASSYYLPAILADPIGRDLGVSANWIFAAFSAALVI